MSSGAFTGIQARVVSMLARGRADVLFEFMNGGTKVPMKATALQRLDAAESSCRA